ncbi:MAG: hypothetical protein E6H03_11260 [Bacillati bacterium ANGP1]|uniref:Toxin-antitoxin system n=1 Tax=Candidatus Segetimicrobium genomatis TaxID=2569760 RepID=A0A537J5U4_9BACT|nr:MAG: hypothetical protein E6H03_11260 [Terrabacteria group bacterium ANGP1]
MVALNLRVGQTLKRRLAARAKGQHRPLSEQARRYIELAMIAEDNPDLPFRFIEKVLAGTAEVEAGLAEPVAWGRR